MLCSTGDADRGAQYVLSFQLGRRGSTGFEVQGEPTETEIADDNTIRECVTISRGTEKGGGITRVGSNNLLMAYVHVGHDRSSATIASWPTRLRLPATSPSKTTQPGAFSPVHQFCTVGEHAFIGGGTIVTQDVLPFR